MAEVISARDVILARIRSAIGHSAPPQAAGQAWQAIPRGYNQASQLGRIQIVDLFVDRLRDYGADVDRCRPAQVAYAIAEKLRNRSKRAMLASHDIDPALLSQASQESNCSFVSGNDLSYEEINHYDGVLTGCIVAIAKTGTIGICHGPQSSRRAITLIPDYHLCVAQASVIVESVPEAVLVLEPYKTQAITLISGPSATADIEMTRIQGVHGPRALDVIIVE